MLKADNVRLLGGEVDTLVEANTLLNSLQSAMDASNENAGKEHSQTFTGSEVRKNNTDRAGDRGTQQNPVAGPSGRGATPASANESSFKKGNAGTRANEYNQKDNRKLQTHTSVQPAGKQPGGQVQDISQQDYDALMEDMDDFMDEIDDQVPMVKPVNTTDRFHGNAHQRSNAGSVQISSTAVPRQNQQQCSQQSSKQTFQKESCVLQSRSDLMVSNSNKPTSSDLGNCGDDLEAMDFEDDFPPMDDDFEKMCGNTDEKENKCSVRESTKPDNGSAIRNVKDVATSNGTTAKIVQSSLTNFVHRSTDQNKSEPSSHKHLNIKEENVHTKNIKDENIASVAKVSETVTDKVKTLKVENLPVMKSAGSDSGLIGQSHGQVARILQLKRQQAELVKCGNTDDLECEYPFTYLCKVMGQPLTQQPVYHTVKAYISTLTSKLNNVDNKWTLSCKINDGTRAVDVDLSSQLLTEMIGFSPAEANTMKARIRTEPGLKQVLKDGIQQCQQKLTELMCLLELETSTSLPRPKVVATKQVTSHHTNMLYNRVLANWKLANWKD
ncbi:hypothetical protein DPMN_121386 [Dreissena polymorpha]|uniref:RecQ-mediated genome instability protein 1 C-terminal OB-fold domain-containing protein n=2 Tax=Dreissena polymorpha TaxID=45954 RepID=A0A9D4GLJ7_DREPO|nr:hypothetical protein DPMN_121386 [Dreissena polymorpha]